jgi:hypothetical protein
MTVMLTGSAQAVALGPGYLLRAPGLRGTADLHAGGAAATRSATRGLDDGLDALARALTATDTTEVRQIELTLQPVAGPQAGSALRGPGGDTVLELDVPDAGPDHGQLVLSIDDTGAMRWHLPEPAAAVAGAPLSRSASGGSRRFRIPATVPPPPPGATDLAQRSVFGLIGRRLLKVLVYPLTDGVVGAASDFIARRWEDRRRPYRLRSFTAENHRAADVPTLAPAELSSMAAGGPVLMFVHGTFSTSHGGFGGLPPATLAVLHQRYGGRVLAFDHPTLSHDPDENVRWLRSQWPAVPTELDIVSHSRGGLVSRALAREAGQPLRVRRIVFGATPNSGTLLADPDHMVDMVDRLTTALSLFPTGPVSETLEALITVVKVLGHGGLKGLDGLASMHPQGAFLAALNRDGASAAEYFAIAANYQATDRGLRSLVTGTVDNVLDQVFGDAPNDLVVPTAGVHAKNGDANFPVQDDRVLLFEPAQGVMHTGLFEHPAVSEKLLAWLT